MKTEATSVTGTCYIWAHPKTDWEISQELKDKEPHEVLPFKYVITTSESSWTKGAVLVHSFEVIGAVPPGVDLVQAAIKTLRSEIEEARKEFEQKKEELEEQISKLALITYQPEHEVA